MAQGLHLSQKMALSQVLAPQLQQSLALLQAPTLELKALIEQELQQNPVLEESLAAEVEQEAKNQENSTVDMTDPAEPPADVTFDPATEKSNGPVDDFQAEFERLAQLDQEWREHFSQTSMPQRGFFDVYRHSLKHAVLWPALGNHDAYSADSDTESGVYFDLFTLPRRGQAGGAASGTEAYYSFTYANAHFICLDSEDSNLAQDGEMLSWLRRDLEQSLALVHSTTPRADWIIAYWHHPPYSKGNHDSDKGEGNDQQMVRMREQVLPVLEAAGVDLVLCGHTHLYERSFPLRGHFGHSAALQPSMILERRLGHPERDGPYRFDPGSATRGTIYLNAGSSGHATEEADLHGLDHPVMAVGLNDEGSVGLDIRGRQLDVVFIDDQGICRDWFRIVK